MKNFDAFWTLTVFLAAMSCSSYRNITPRPSEILPTIQPKDKVAVLLVGDKEIKRMEVGSVGSDSLAGTYYQSNKKATITIPIMRIIGIQKLKSDKGRAQKLYVLRPGSIIRIALMSGNAIGELKVSYVDSEKSKG